MGIFFSSSFFLLFLYQERSLSLSLLLPLLFLLSFTLFFTLLLLTSFFFVALFQSYLHQTKTQFTFGLNYNSIQYLCSITVKGSTSLRLPLQHSQWIGRKLHWKKRVLVMVVYCSNCTQLHLKMRDAISMTIPVELRKKWPKE